MKDVYDLVALSNLFEFERQLLVDAISATFVQRLWRCMSFPFG